jgi:hypothetical protein
MALETETFHINIGAGDCTVVCLKEATTNPKPVLHKVVLIDGGKPHQAGVINKFLTVQLPRLFDLKEYPDGIVLIDAVVITHWDDDHFGGIGSLLAEGLTPKDPPSKDPPPPPPPPAQFKHFRYGKDGVPLTYMYVPYMTESGKQSKHDHVFAISEKATDRLKFKIAVGGKPKWCEDVCLFKYGADQVMGVNFFTNVRSPTTMDFLVRPKEPTGGIVPVLPFDDLPSLINSFADIKDGDPGLFSIACNNFVFQKKPGSPGKVADKALRTAFSAHHPHLFIIDKKTGGSDSEQTNSASIIAVLA